MVIAAISNSCALAVRRRWHALVVILVWPGLACAAIPVVGCRAEGQGGPIPAPATASVVPPPLGPAASALAEYVAAGSLTVLAPRFWHCLDIYGSGGARLIVTPEPHDPAELLAPGGLPGPVVVMDFINGENSGRFEVARLVARLFPAHAAYARRIAEDDGEPRSRYPARPYKQDRLHHRSASALEFTTPPHTIGLGTYDQVLSADAPIQGLITVRRRDFGMEARRLLIRLPSNLQPLTSVIIQATKARPDQR